MVLMVGYQKVIRGKRAELDELNRRWREVDKRLGLPPEQQYSCMYGARDGGTLLLLREWESMAAIEEAYAKMMADPEIAELMTEANDIIESTQWELYYPSP
jgi:hypothetical protein